MWQEWPIFAIPNDNPKNNETMKRITLALMCMASLALTMACSDKKADKAAEAEGENTEVAAGDVQNADEQETGSQSNGQADAWGDPAKAEVLNLATLYANGDFKPAPALLFEDTLGGETKGELPSKWDVARGSAEVGEANGHYYITMLGGSTELTPLVGGSKLSLPAKYTMEFEFMFGQEVLYRVNFFDAEGLGIADYNMWPHIAEWNMAKTDDEWMSGNRDNLLELLARNGWNHFAASYDNGNLKLFINGKRIANLPNIKQAAYFVITGDEADGKSHFIRNIRVAGWK